MFVGKILIAKRGLSPYIKVFLSLLELARIERDTVVKIL